MNRVRIMWPALLLAFSTTALAQGSFLQQSVDREGRWDISIGPLFQDSESQGGPQGSRLEVNSDTGVTFQLDYHFTDRLSLGFGMDFISPRYEATIVPDNGDPEQVINHKADMFNGHLRGTWNVLPGAFTPYLRASMGWTTIDSNVADGPPQTGCWWDPWWGYTCQSFWDTYDDSGFSYGGGVGLRWDINESVMLRGGYDILQTDIGDDLSFGQSRLEIGWRF